MSQMVHDLCRVLAILGILLMAAHGGLANGCGNYSDGCTIFNDFPFKKIFEPACYRHDVCYSCGVKFNLTRKACDGAFVTDMKAVCTSVATSQRDECDSFVGVYYAGVRLLGDPFFNKQGNSYCDQRWVVPCLP